MHKKVTATQGTNNTRIEHTLVFIGGDITITMVQATEKVVFMAIGTLSEV